MSQIVKYCQLKLILTCIFSKKVLSNWSKFSILCVGRKCNNQNYCFNIKKKRRGIILIIHRKKWGKYFKGFFCNLQKLTLFMLGGNYFYINIIIYHFFAKTILLHNWIFQKKINLANLHFLLILKVENTSFPMMNYLSYLDIKHDILRGGNSPPPANPGFQIPQQG